MGHEIGYHCCWFGIFSHCTGVSSVNIRCRECVQSGRKIALFSNVTTSSPSASASPPKLNSLTFLKSLSLAKNNNREQDIYFLAPFLRCSSSLSRCTSSLARCCARFSAAVIRGTISLDGLSVIRMDLIFGGLPSYQLAASRKDKSNSLHWSAILVNLCIKEGWSVKQSKELAFFAHPYRQSSSHL